jgi:hypothetical protein
MGNLTIKRPFSIAMLVFQRVTSKTKGGNERSWGFKYQNMVLEVW